MLAFALQLEAPPQDRAGGHLAGVQQGGAPLPVPADPHAQVDHARRLPGEIAAGLGFELAGSGDGAAEADRARLERLFLSLA